MKPKILISQSTSLQNYVETLEAHGAEATAKYLPEYSDEYDALLLSGGVDVHPGRYGEEINGSINMDEKRDAAEIELIRRFVEAGKPIMGICRGHQLINIFFGGSLVQHIATTDAHRAEDDAVHTVRSELGSILTELYGERFPVNSNHHQAIKTLGRGLRAVQFSDADGIIEGVEHEALPIIGVQWHPERTTLGRARPDTVDGGAVFDAFIALCKRHMENKTT